MPQNFYVNKVYWRHILYFLRLSNKERANVHYKNINFFLRFVVALINIFNSSFLLKKILIIDSQGDYDDEKYTQINGKFVIEDVLVEADLISKKVIENEVKDSIFLSFFTKLSIPESWMFRYYQHQIYWDIYWDLMIMAIPTSIQGNGSRWILVDKPLNQYLQSSKFWNVKLGLILDRPDNDQLLIRLFLLACRLFGYIVPSFSPSKYKEEDTINTKVAIEFVWGVNLDKLSDLYWYKESGIDPSNIIIYLNRQDKNPTQKEFAQIHDMGLTVIDLSFLGLINKLKVLLRTLNIFVHLGSDFFGQAKSTTSLSLYWWLKSFLRLSYKISFWSNFFSSNNIKAHMSHSGDSGSEHVCQSIAAELSGAINVRSNYSYTSITHSGQSREFHTYFLWGEQSSCATKKRIKSKTEVIAGYPFDYLFSKKNQIKYDSGKALSLGLFDTTISHRFLKTFYTEMFCLANKHQIKLVIKPKKNNINLIKSIPGYLDLVDKELIIIESRTTRPYEICNNVDLSVCVGINSAGIEAALSGNRSVYWVPHKYFCKQLDSPNLSLVYYDIKDLSDMIANLNKEQILNSNIGNHESFIDKIDPWMDGRAGERIGSYLFDYLDAVKCNESPKSSLEIANSIYSNKWGAEYVTCNKLD